MNLADYRGWVLSTLQETAADIQYAIERHPKELPAGNAVLDELLRLKAEVQRSLDRLA